MAWNRRFETGEAVIDGDTVWGTAMYDDPESRSILFRRHPRNVGISPSHNPPTPDPGAEEIPSSAFKAVEWTAQPGSAGR